MSVDTLTRNPENIRTTGELQDIIDRIDSFERMRNCKAGVLLIQRRLFSATYRIVSDEEAHQWMTRPIIAEPRTVEWGLEFYPKSYFEELGRYGLERKPKTKILKREDYQ